MLRKEYVMAPTCTPENFELGLLNSRWKKGLNDWFMDKPMIASKPMAKKLRRKNVFFIV